MEKNIQPIPTYVNGVRFKSRLEARFVQWLLRNSDRDRAHIIYQPRRFARNQYQADFLIASPHAERMFIEIKPLKYANEAWMAIEAAVETGESLMIIDDFGRDDWHSYGSVVKGTVEYFSTRKNHALPVSVPAYYRKS